VAVVIANLWVQSGMKARNAAILGAALTVTTSSPRPNCH
jgi:hypothetical protein